MGEGRKGLGKRGMWWICLTRLAREAPEAYAFMPQAGNISPSLRPEVSVQGATGS